MSASPRALFRVQCDGSSRGNPGPAGIGVVVLDPAGNAVKEISYAIGDRTNNQAEYEALIRALVEAAGLPRPVVVEVDSELVYRQLEGRYRVRNELLKPLYERARALLDRAEGVSLRLARRGDNRPADRLAQAASRAAKRYRDAQAARKAAERGAEPQAPGDGEREPAGEDRNAGCAGPGERAEAQPDAR